MFSVAGDNVLPSGLEMPGHGKRSLMPPPPTPTSKKQLKNLSLNSNSKNPLLSGNAMMDTEDPWHLAFLEATENDIRTPEEKEFDIPSGMEAFAEKIGLSWDLTPRSDQEVTEVRPPSPSPVFQDDAIPQAGPEEAVWGDLVSPMEVEGRHFTEPVVETEQTASTDITMNNTDEQGKMNPSIVLTEKEIEKEKIPQLTEAEYKELDAFLETGLESLLNGDEPIAVNEGEKFDIVEFAIGESGLELHEDEDLAEDKPTKTTKYDVDEDYVPDFKKIKTEPDEIDEMKPVQNVSIEVIEEKPRKKRVGRPINTEPITVTVIPKACKLSDNELKALKYKRTRELNNEASRRFRQRKKALEENTLQEVEELRARNYQLQETADRMEREVALLKEKVSKIHQ